MEINKEIKNILKEYEIDKDAGLLVLLGIYFGVDIDTVCPEEVVKAINVTKIVERDYRLNKIVWNIPLFQNQVTAWDWVKGYNDAFGKINPSRKDSLVDVTKRMMDFFSKYPQYREQDVKNAVAAYFRTITDPQYLKSSAKFIFDGRGVEKKSLLLAWCEKVTNKEINTNNGQKGRIVS